VIACDSGSTRTHHAPKLGDPRGLLSIDAIVDTAMIAFVPIAAQPVETVIGRRGRSWREHEPRRLDLPALLRRVRVPRTLGGETPTLRRITTPRGRA